MRPAGAALLRTFAAAAVCVLAAMACGTAFGVLREFHLRAALGLSGAILVETPLLLVLCAFVVRAAIPRFGIAATVAARAALGAAMLVLQLLAEDALSRALRGRSAFEVWAHYPPAAFALNAAGLAGLALLPLVLLALDRRRAGHPGA